MYVIANNIYEGILEIDSNNVFQRYFGETSVDYTALDLLWRELATEEQKAKQALWLPTEYSSMAMSGTGFIYACISYKEEDEPIRLLNVKGTNILAYNEEFECIGIQAVERAPLQDMLVFSDIRALRDIRRRSLNQNVLASRGLVLILRLPN